MEYGEIDPVVLKMCSLLWPVLVAQERDKTWWARDGELYLVKMSLLTMELGMVGRNAQKRQAL